MKTKKVISIGLAAMMSFTALTCSAATAYAEEKKDEVAGGKDVTISIMGRKVEIHDAMLEAADRYMELHPNVTVVMETVGGGDDYDGTLKTRLNGGNMPTIFTLQGPLNWDEWGENMRNVQKIFLHSSAFVKANHCDSGNFKCNVNLERLSSSISCNQ